MRPLRIEDIGGGKVLVPFNAPGLTDVPLNHQGKVARGSLLTADQLAGMPAANRNALIENRYIDVWPKEAKVITLPVVRVERNELPSQGGSGTVGSGSTAPSLAGPAERHMVPGGFGTWVVFEGRKIGEKLSREEAERLVAAGGKPVSTSTAPVATPAKAKPKRKVRSTVQGMKPPKKDEQTAPPAPPEDEKKSVA